MLRQIKPRTARSARAHALTLPLPTENPKRTLLLRGTSSSSLINTLLSDLHSLKRPLSIRLHKRNPNIHPFDANDGVSSLEFLSTKNDASLIVYGSHSKKRPHGLTWVRCFDGRVLDVLEVGVVEGGARGLRQFMGGGGGGGWRVGVKPMLSFSGTAFESPVANGYTLAKSLFVDFFRGGEAREVDVEGLQLLISFFAGEEGPGGEKPVIQMRCWRIVTRRSGGGGRVPRVEVVEVGPRIDMRVGRVREAQEGMWKEAMRRGKGGEKKEKKNVETDTVGDKIGRIHLGRQDLGELQSRKMKGLKRGRDVDEEVEVEGDGIEEEDVVSDDEVVDDDSDNGEGGVKVKRQKVA